MVRLRLGQYEHAEVTVKLRGSDAAEISERVRNQVVSDLAAYVETYVGAGKERGK